MYKIFEIIKDNATLVIAVAVTTVLGTLLLKKLFSKTKKRRYPRGSGPTGKGKWKLYHTNTFRSARCLLLIEEMDALDDFEIIEYSPYTTTPEEREHYKKNVHPHGLVPAMVTSEGDIMIESAAICLHLAQLYGRCLPDEQNEATYVSWSINASATADHCLDVVYRQLYKTAEKDRNTKSIELNTYKCLEWIGNLEKLLDERPKKRKYICSNGFTAADVIVGYNVFYANLIKGGMLLRDSPNIQEYLTALKARPLWNKCIGTAREWMTGPQSYEDEE